MNTVSRLFRTSIALHGYRRYTTPVSKKEILYSFCFYSVVGWGLDSFARSIIDLRWQSDNLLGIPFSPTYGFGALGFLFLYNYIKEWQFWEQFVLYTTISAAYEYSVGALSLWFLDRRLWDYSDIPLNINGHTDIFHALIWGMLAILVTHRLQPWLQDRFFRTASAANPEKL